MEDDACQGLHNLSISEESTLAQCIQEKYSRLILQSKELVSGGKVTEALELNQKAYRLCPSDKLLRKIQRMQTYLKENSTEAQKEDEISESATNPPAISSRKERASSSSPSNGVLPPKRHPSSVSSDTSGVASPSVQAMYMKGGNNVQQTFERVQNIEYCTN